MTLLTVSHGSGVKRVRIQGQKGVIRAHSGSKVAEYGPIQALRSCPALSNGYLDLSNTCPGWPRTGSGYRVTTAEDTVTRWP